MTRRRKPQPFAIYSRATMRIVLELAEGRPIREDDEWRKEQIARLVRRLNRRLGRKTPGFGESDEAKAG